MAEAQRLLLHQAQVGPMANFVYLIGDPVTRKAAVVDPAWDTGDDGWPEIIDGMLQQHEYMPGCKRCHRAFIENYRKQYHDRKIGPL